MATMNYGVYLASLALVLEIFVGLSWSNEGDIPCWPDCRPHAPIPIGQPNRLIEGVKQPRQPIKNVLGGIYSQNTTLYFRNSPYRVERELVVESGVILIIETGVQMYFDTGVGIKVFGTIQATGNEFAHIQMLPYQEQMNYDQTFPNFKLIDGPSVRQGRLQVKFRNRWRSVCTQLTNWTSIDTTVACRSMGYTDGGFWRFYLRNNDTYPFVMPAPRCSSAAVKNLWECEGFTQEENIPLSENLCQGEDDLGIYCWGPPSFNGWSKHWKGIQLYNSPSVFRRSDPDDVEVHRESLSRLEFVDILYAGYDGLSKNTTAALHVEGVVPIINGLRVEYSARDGIYLYEPNGPVMIANSTISRNRGHGIVIEQALDGRVFVNQTKIYDNWGDGVWYRQMHPSLSLIERFYGFGIGSSKQISSSISQSRWKRHFFGALLEPENARIDMCQDHNVPTDKFFPHLIRAHIQNGTTIDPLLAARVCWALISLPPRLPYYYTIQFIDVLNRNPHGDGSHTNLIICEGNNTFPSVCQAERYRIPIQDGVLPQSISLPSSGKPVYLGLEHIPGPGSMPMVAGNVDLLFQVHASVTTKAIYGLNITNSHINNNTGNGILAMNVRDRTALSNVNVDGNQGLAGFLVRDGAADIWINDTSLSHNWGDGLNISYAGGSINLNGSRIVGNRWRGFAFHHNSTIPFYPLHFEIIVKGRPSNNPFYPRSLIADNLWGGMLVGNYCAPAFSSGTRARVIVSTKLFQKTLAR